MANKFTSALYGIVGMKGRMPIVFSGILLFTITSKSSAGSMVD